MTRKILNSVPLLISLLSILSFGSILGIVIYSLNILDDAEKLNIKKRVEVAFELEHLRVQELLTEYSYWDEGHERLIENFEGSEKDLLYAQEYLADFLLDENGIKLIIFGKPENQKVNGYLNGKYFTISYEALLQTGFGNLLKANIDNKKLDTFWTFKEQSYVAVVNEFWLEETEEKAGDDSFILFAKSLSPEYLSNVSELYHLPPLIKTNKKMISFDSFNRIETYGGDEHIVYWQPPSLNNITLNLIFTLTLIAIINVLLVVSIFRKLQVEHLQQKRALEKLANYDYLTGILNRRAFMKRANEMVTKELSTSKPFCLMMLDLDNFKSINDSYGHHIGDEVLISVSNRIKGLLNGREVFGRFGGEEFTLLIYPCDQVESENFANKILQAVQEIDTSDFSSDSFDISVSIGIKHFKKKLELEGVIQKADEALYKAKNNGKNQFHYA